MTQKHSDLEEEYFRKVDAQKKKQLSEELHDQEVEEKTNKLRDLHWMHCPKCGNELHDVTFRGVEIDRCVACNGVWLDDGELEKLAGQDSGFLREIVEMFRSKS